MVGFGSIAPIVCCWLTFSSFSTGAELNAAFFIVELDGTVPEGGLCLQNLMT